MDKSVPERCIVTRQHDVSVAVKYVREVYERVMLPFFERTATPAGFLRFMVEPGHEGAFVSSSPSPVRHFQRASLVAELLPEAMRDEVMVALREREDAVRQRLSALRRHQTDGI